MFENRYYGATIEMSAPILNPKFVDNLLMRTNKVQVRYDFAVIKEIHPKMDPLNYHESILKRALNGDIKEAQCLTITGDFNVLAKLFGLANIAKVMEAQEIKAKAAEEDTAANPGYTARATEAVKNIFTRSAKDAAEESTDSKEESTDSAETPPKTEDGPTAGAEA